jgi:hypothetical protein
MLGHANRKSSTVWAAIASRSSTHSRPNRASFRSVINAFKTSDDSSRSSFTTASRTSTLIEFANTTEFRRFSELPTRFPPYLPVRNQLSTLSKLHPRRTEKTPSPHRPLPNLIQHPHHLRHSGWQKQRLRPLLADVGKRRLIKPCRIHHPVLGQVLNNQVDEL